MCTLAEMGVLWWFCQPSRPGLGVLHLLFLFFVFNLFYLVFFLAMLGLHCCAHAFSSCRDWGLYSLLSTGFSWWLLLPWSTRSRAHSWLWCSGFSSGVSRQVDNPWTTRDVAPSLKTRPQDYSACWVCRLYPTVLSALPTLSYIKPRNNLYPIIIPVLQ